MPSLCGLPDSSEHVFGFTHSAPCHIEHQTHLTDFAVYHPGSANFDTLNTLNTRHLAGDASPPKPTLTPEQLQRITDLRAFAAKKQKVAHLLIESDLPEEA